MCMSYNSQTNVVKYDQDCGNTERQFDPSTVPPNYFSISPAIFPLDNQTVYLCIDYNYLPIVQTQHQI